MIENYNQTTIQNIYYLDENNNIKFFMDEDLEESIKGPRVIIYDGEYILDVVPIVYEEILVGRKSIDATPEIDLSEIDESRYTSRRHAMIYKYEGDYYIKKLSQKNSLHVNAEAVVENEVKLNDNDMIILSRKFPLKFRL